MVITFTIVAVKFSRKIVKFVFNSQPFKAEFFKFSEFMSLLWCKIFVALCCLMHFAAGNTRCFRLPPLRFLHTFLNIVSCGTFSRFRCR